VSGMARPKKYRDGYRPWTLMRLTHGEEVYRKAEELAEREMISLSELVLKSLAEHVKAHYPGNPQTPLFPLEDQLRAYVAARKRAQLAALLDNPWPSRGEWLQAVDVALDKLMRQPERSPEILALMQRALQVVG